MANWNANTVPECKERECSDVVLATVQSGGYKRVVRAVYMSYHHCTLEDMCWNMCDGVPDDWEYIEDNDTWWVPEGWYEVADFFGDYEYATIEGKVLAWKKMPKAYEPRVKELN